MRRIDDRGSALVITLMVIALVMALSTTVAVLTVDNLRGSMRTQQAGSAINAADAGVAQAVTYLRRSGVNALNQCATTPATCTTPWGKAGAPMVVDVGNDGGAGEKYQVWIEPKKDGTGAAMTYPRYDPGIYLVHSTGTAAGGASRTVSVEITVTASTYPRGVFAHSISGGGNASMTNESVFSTGCVARRSQIQRLPGENGDYMDLAYGIPIGVHTSDYITNQNVNELHCTPSQKKLIHKTGVCNASFPADQDRLGGDLGSSCENVQGKYPRYFGPQDLDGVAGNDVAGSYIKDDATLLKLFGIKDPVFTPEELDQLRAVAQDQKSYFTSLSSMTVADWSPDEDSAVMFFDLSAVPDNQGAREVNLNNIKGFTPADACTRSLVVVIVGGNAKLNSNQQLAASLFLTSTTTYGQLVKANGTSDYVGTVYADTVNLVGTTNFSLNKCFVANPSPYLLNFQVGEYHEADRALD